MATTEDPRIKRFEEAANKWKAELHVRNTFLEARMSEDGGSLHSTSSRASSDPTHSSSSSNASSWSQSSVAEDGIDLTSDRHISVAATSNSSEIVREGSGLSALALSATMMALPTPSVGSALHAEGGCSPCFFFPAKKGCRAGTNCKFCHMPHEIQPRTRPSKERRAKAKRIAEAVVSQSSEVDASTLIEQSLASASDASKNPSYLQQVILSKLKSDGTSSPSSGQRSQIVSL